MSIATNALPADYEHVNHPSHYNSHPSGVEAIEIVRWLPFNTGNAFKYLYRRGEKGNLVQDLEKALWYVKDEFARVTNSLELGAAGKSVHYLPAEVTELLSAIVRAEDSLSAGIGKLYVDLALDVPRQQYLKNLGSASVKIMAMVAQAKAGK